LFAWETRKLFHDDDDVFYFLKEEEETHPYATGWRLQIVENDIDDDLSIHHHHHHHLSISTRTTFLHG